jgi:hypothetical protein
MTTRVVVRDATESPHVHVSFLPMTIPSPQTIFPDVSRYCLCTSFHESVEASVFVFLTRQYVLRTSVPDVGAREILLTFQPFAAYQKRLYLGKAISGMVKSYRTIRLRDRMPCCQASRRRTSDTCRGRTRSFAAGTQVVTVSRVFLARGPVDSAHAGKRKVVLERGKT